MAEAWALYKNYGRGYGSLIVETDLDLDGAVIMTSLLM